MDHKENRIKELRTIEATKKKYIGLGGKLGTIIRTMGESIIRQDATGFNQNLPISNQTSDNNIFWRDYSQEESTNILDLIPTMEVYDLTGLPYADMIGDEWNIKERTPYFVEEIGKVFDALKYGVNLQLKYMKESSTLSCHYSGNLVYLEIKGELKAFIPNKRWEEKIESFYTKAKNIDKKLKQDYQNKKKEEFKKTKTSLLEKLRLFWGI